MSDPATILKARKAQLLAEAQRRADALVAEAQRQADALDRDAPELERLAMLAAKYGLEVVEKKPAEMPAKPNGAAPDDSETERQIVVNPDLPAYRAAISACEQALRAANKPLELSELFDVCTVSGVLAPSCWARGS